MAAITYWCVIKHVPAIQQQVQGNAQSALDAAGAPNVNLEVNGRIATLSGAVASETIKSQLVETVSSAKGVRSVTDQLSITGQSVADNSNSAVIGQSEADQSEVEQSENDQAEADQSGVGQPKVEEDTPSDTAPAAEAPEQAPPVESDEIASKALENDESASESNASSDQSETTEPEATDAVPAEADAADAEETQPASDTATLNTDAGNQSVEEMAQALVEKARAQRLTDAGTTSSDPVSTNASDEVDGAELANDSDAELVNEEQPADQSSDNLALPSFSMEINNDTMDLSGTMSNRDNMLGFIEAGMKSLNVSYVINGVEAQEDIQQASWLPSLTNFMPKLEGLSNASIDIMETQISIEGVVTSEALHDQIINDALSSLSGLSLVERIRVDESAAAPTNAVVTPDTQATTNANVSTGNERRASLRQGIDALGDETILFESGSDVLTSESLRSVEQIAALLVEYPEFNVEINGHTDSSGNATNNLRLSQLRANSVRDALARQGVSTSRLAAYGYGDGVPIADNDTPAGRKLNRRIEFNF